MTNERKVCCGVAVAIANDRNQVLMGKRTGSHGAGSWSFPGGWMRHSETFEDTAAREVAEETSITLIKPPRVINVGTTLFKEADIQSTTIMMLAERGTWTGEPKVMESDKVDGQWKWFDLEKLPEPLFEPLQKIKLKELLENSFSWKFPIQEQWHQMREDLGDAADAKLIEKLEELIAHLKSGKYPQVFGCRIPDITDKSELLFDYQITLSHLWPG